MITFLEESSKGHKSKLYPSPHRLSIAADRSLILVPDWRWIWRRRGWCIEANPSSTVSSIIIRSRQVTCLLLLVTGIIQRSLLVYSFWILVFQRESNRKVSRFYCSVLVAKVEDRKRTWLDHIIMGFNLKTRRDERQEWCPRRAQVYYLNTCTKIGISYS